MNGFCLYLRYIGISLRGQMRYRANLVMMTVGYSLGAVADVLALFALFGRFGGIGQWTAPEVALFYGTAITALTLSEAWMRGFYAFHYMIRDAGFDRVLLRPRSTILQIIGTDFQLLRLGRCAVGIGVIVWAVRALGISWSAGQWALLVSSILGGVLLFSGIVMAEATSCFWTVEVLDLFSLFTYGGVETARYPLDIYGKWLMRFFVYVVPVASINYWPMSVLLSKGYVPAVLSYLSPLFGVAFFGIGLLIWRFGVKHYRSTGS